MLLIVHRIHKNDISKDYWFIAAARWGLAHGLDVRKNPFFHKLEMHMPSEKLHVERYYGPGIIRNGTVDGKWQLGRYYAFGEEVMP